MIFFERKTIFNTFFNCNSFDTIVQKQTKVLDFLSFFQYKKYVRTRNLYTTYNQISLLQ